MRKILISGGLGFIGGAVALELKKRDFAVSIIDDLSDNVYDIDDFTNKGIQVYLADIYELKTIKTLLFKRDFDIVLHCAAKHFIPFCNKNPFETLKTNIIGTTNLLEVSRNTNVNKFIFLSSLAIYKPSKNLHSENSTIEPPDIYGISKKNGEEIIKYYSKNYNFNYGIIRLSNIYGSMDNVQHFIPILCKAAKSKSTINLGNISTIRDYLYIDDAVDAIYKLVSSEYINNFCYNVCSRVGTSGKSIIKTIEDITNEKIIYKINPQKIRNNDRPKLVGENENVKKDISWIPKYTIRKGLIKILNI